MKTNPAVLLLTFVGFFYFTSASGFPEVPTEHIVVEMKDGSHLTGLLKKEETYKIPIWLKPGSALPKCCNVFIMEESEVRYTAKLQYITPGPSTLLPMNHSQHNLDHSLKYAEIRLGSYHFTARNFYLHEKTIITGTKRNIGVYPSKNHIYISSPNGIIYASMLEPHQADHRENRGRYPTTELTRIEPVTALDDRRSQITASGFPEVPAEQLVVEMGDGSHFKGLLNEEEDNKIPTWLKGGTPLPKFYHVFIIEESDARFSSKLKVITPVPSTPLPMNHSQHNLDHGPMYAEIRLGNDYLTARNFCLHERLIKRRIGRNIGVNPSKNHIYVSFPNGIIYTSMLESHQANHRENRGGYPTPEVTRMEPLTALAASSRQRSRSNSPIRS